MNTRPCYYKCNLYQSLRVPPRSVHLAIQVPLYPSTGKPPEGQTVKGMGEYRNNWKSEHPSATASHLIHSVIRSMDQGKGRSQGNGSNLDRVAIAGFSMQALSRSILFGSGVFSIGMLASGSSHGTTQASPSNQAVTSLRTQATLPGLNCLRAGNFPDFSRL